MTARTRAIRTFAVIIIMGLTTFLGYGIPASAQDVPSDTWMGIYRGPAKIGYAHLRTDKETYKGAPGLRCDSRVFIRILALGMFVEQELLTTMHVTESYKPISETFEMRSGGSITKIEAVFEPDKITAVVYSEDTKETQTFPIPPGSNLVGDPMFFPAGHELKVGSVYDYKYFNLVGLTLDDVHAEVLQTDTVEIEGVQTKTLVLRNMTPLGEMRCWLDEKGNVLKVNAILGLSMVMEPKEKALKFENTYLPPEDLAVATSAPSDKEILAPRYVKSLKIKLIGLSDKKLALSDNRQRVTYIEGEKPVGEYTIRASEFSPDASLELPIKDKDVMKGYLGDSAYVQTSNSEIKEQAKKIVGDETNAFLAAGMIRAWVNTNMKSKADIGIMRSAVDVLHGKTGVCRDYAVLYAALARAAGIPTKMVSGLVYFEGRFYYHAWAESFVGEWVPFDATLTTDFVDATHIKLAEGEATSMFDMVKTMGALKAEVVEAN